MKKAQKRLVSALAAGASVAVLAPSVTAFADTQVSEADVQSLILTAQTTKSFADFNKAFAAVQSLTDKNPNYYKYLAQLDPIGKVVLTPEVKAAVDAFNAYGQKTDKGLGDYWQTYNTVVNSTVLSQADKNYFIADLDSWGKSQVFTPDAVAATNAIIALGTSYSDANVAAAQAAAASVKNAGSQAWLVDQINQAVARHLIDVAKASGLQADVDAAKAAIAKVTDSAAAAYLTAQVNAIDTSFKVVSLTALNATQAKVVFSQPVASGTNSYAQDINRYKIGSDKPTSAVLQADGKTVILTFADATTLTGSDGSTKNTGVTNAAVVVEPVESAADIYTLTPRFVTLLTYKDTVKPGISSIVSTTNGAKASQVTVNFTEPVSSLGSVKIDGNGVVGAFTDATQTAATFNIDLDASTTHTIQFFGLTDKATNVADLFAQSFSITTDKTAPTVNVTPSADVDHAFVLTFNKDVDPTTVVGNGNIKVLDETLGSDFGTPTITQLYKDNKKVYLVTGDKTIFGSKSSRTFTVSVPSSVTDTLGNAFNASTSTVTLNRDTVKPSISNVKVVKDPSGNVTKIVLTSTSTLSAVDISGYSSVDSNGVVSTGKTALGVLSANAINPGDNTVTIVPAKPAPLTGKYTFNFAAGTLKDQAETANASDATSVVVDFGTASSGNGTFTIPSTNYAPSAGVVNSTLQPVVTANVYQVKFGTAVKGGNVAGSATDLSHYTINGNALPTGTTITLDTVAGPTTATITLPAGSVGKTDSGAVLYISGIQDANGNTVVPVSTQIQVNDNVAPTLTSAVLNSDNSITIGFSEALKADPKSDASDFVVSVNGNTISGLAVQKGTGTDTGKYVLTGLGSLEKYDTTAKETYLDLDGDGKLTSNKDLVLSTIGDKTGSKLTDFNAVSSLTVKTADKNTITDVAGNPAIAGTTISIK